MSADDYIYKCQLSGFEVPFSETRVMWNGLRVWYPYWKPRNPQTYLQVPPVEEQPQHVNYPQDRDGTQNGPGYFAFQDNNPITFNSGGIMGEN